MVHFLQSEKAVLSVCKLKAANISMMRLPWIVRYYVAAMYS